MKFSLRSYLSLALTALAATTVVAAPVMTPTGVTATAASAAPGDTITITVGAANAGAATPTDDLGAGGTVTGTVIFTHRVTGATISTGSVTFTTAAIVAGAGGAGSFTRTFSIPTVTSQAGAYDAAVTLTAASGGGTASGSFTAVSALTVTGTPDLDLTNLTYPAGTAYRGGDVIAMSISYTNRTSSNGANNVPYVSSTNGNASFFRIEVVLSSNPIFGDADDFLLTQHDVSASSGAPLNANNVSTTFNWNQVLPGNFAGSYYVLAKIDTLSGITETVENDLTDNGNNIYYSPDQTATRISLLPTNFPTVNWASRNGNAYSDNPSVSTDGRYTAFASDSTNLGTNDTNGVRDIFLYDNQTATVRKISLSQQGAETNTASNHPALSGNGTYVAFSSEATNLITSDTNGFSDIYVVNALTGTLARVSVATDGSQANGGSFKPAISTTGRYIAFESTATNLIAAGTTVGVTHIYVHDRDVSGSGTFDTAGNISTGLVSQSSGAAQGNGNSIQASISGGGQYVVFASDATNLGGTVAGGFRNIYLRDVTGSTTTLVSFDPGLVGTDGSSRAPALNQDNGQADDGQYVAFGSEATNLIAGDTNAVSDIFVYNRSANTITRVSLSSADAEAADPSATAAQRMGSINPSISATGRYVAFSSLANNLTAGDSIGQSSATDANGSLDVFVRDRDVSGSGTFDTGGNVATTLVSKNRFGLQTVGILSTNTSTPASDVYPVISGNGRWVAFPSDAENTGGLAHGATNRTSPDSNTFRDVFLHDRRINALPAAGTPPSVSISSPVTGTTYPVNTALTLVGSASASSGTIASVQFFVNGTSLGTSTVFPYNATWTPTATGTFALSALVTDSFGNQAVSTNVNITIAAVSPTSPTVSITSPANGSSVFANAATTVSASATDSDGTIASVAFYANNVLIGTDTTFPYSVSFTPTATGSYTLTAVATDNGGNQTTTTGAGSSTITVADLAAPTISIVSPTPVQINAATTITATATTSGSIASVQFLANGTTLGTLTSAPFTFSWTPTAAGSYSLSAVATDNLGSQTTSSNITVVVSAGASPVFSPLTPTVPASVPVNTAQTIEVGVSDSDGVVASVQFFANGKPIGTASAFPFVTTWTPTTSGSFTIQAVATDNLGNQTTSSAAAVTVTSGTAPSGVTVTVPASLAVNTTGTLSAVATPTAPATIASIQFLANGTLIGTDTSFPYSVTFTPTTTGTYAITAIATDTLGNRTTSAAANIAVGSNTSPSVSVTTPADLSSVLAGASTTVTASASDVDGSITSVQFLANGVSLGSATTSPYTATWRPTLSGSVLLTAVATDNSGATTTSAVNTITVTTGNLPTVTLTSPATGAVVPVNSSQTLTATATATVGTITNVEFFVSDGVITTSVGVDPTFPYTATWNTTAAASPSNYSLFAVATDTAGNKRTSSSATITVSLGAPGAPTVSLLSPVNGTAVSANHPLVLAAAAADPDGAVALVEFSVTGPSGTVLVGAKATAPYYTIWTPTVAGAYSITATVTDNENNRTTTAAAALTVAAQSGELPVAAVYFNNPAADTPTSTTSAVDPFVPVDVSIGSHLIITGLAVDSDGTIASVQFFVNGTSIATDASAPFYTTHTLATLGPVVISALVTDNTGNAVYTTPLFLNSQASIAATAANATLVSPVAGSSYVVGEAIVFQATHNFGSDVPPKIDFYLNGNQLTTVSAAPYQFIRSLTRAGTYDVHAVVRSGTVTTVSAVRQITVTSNTAPTVSITSPNVGTTASIGTPLAVTADASDPDGTISKVEFFANGSSIGSDTTLPYGVTFSPGSSGVYNLTAIATDNGGNETVSAVRSVTFTGGTAPTVAITSPLTGGSVAIGATRIIDATAGAAAPATIANVQFLVNGLGLSTDPTFPYSASWAPTAPGTYSLTAIATDSVGIQVTSAAQTITVASNVAPTVSVTAPAAGFSVGVGSANTVTASATDADGSVTQVQFFVDSILIGTDTTFPYTATWTPTIAAASTSITAVATDDLGLVTTSATISGAVTSGLAPTVSLTLPAASAAVNASITLTASASPTVVGNTIASVQFSANGVDLGTATAFPYTVNWQPSALGTYTLRALATDSAGNQATASVTLPVTANASPVVSIGTPVNASVVPVGTATTINATATDADGTIASVQFLVNGVLLSTDTTSPYSASWTPTIDGSYSLTAIATDNAGATTTSGSIGVTAGGGNAPSVSLAAPLAGAIAVGSSNPVTALASASLAGATITQVQFFANNISVGSANTFPFTITWTPTVTGTYALTAVATDTSGNQATSASVSVTVAANVPPPVFPVTVVASLGVGTATAVSASPTDSDGSIASVEFFATPAGGTAVSLGLDTSTPFSVSWTPTTVGTYAVTAVATDNVGATTTSTASSVSVTAGAAPTVSIVWPAAASTVLANTSQTIVASATAATGTIASVEFFVNGASLLVDSTYPYNATWTPTATGSFILTSIAIDTAGNRTLSSSVGITVATISPTFPTVSIASPTGGSVPVGLNTTVVGTAVDSDGSVASVEFFANGVSLGVDVLAPYTAILRPAASGNYVLTAIATDNGGNRTTSASVTVAAAAAGSPAVNLNSPTDLDTYTVGSAIALSANAALGSGFISGVDFAANGEVIAPRTVAVTGQGGIPFFNTTWTPAAAGTYVFTATAYDLAGNRATSAPVTVSVTNIAAPVVSLSSPLPAAVLAVNTAQSLAATATSAAGSISQVEFFVNGASVGTDTTFPYTGSWTPTSPGAYALRVVATDNLGNQTTSAPVSVSVASGAAPAVSVTGPTASSNVPVNAATTLTATATANTGTIASVQFFANGVLIGADTSFPYSVSWTPAALGTYTLTALATDTVGNQTTSATPYTVSVIDPAAAPSVSVTSPAAGAIVTGATTITATAAPVGGATITGVEFFANGTSLGAADTTFPYSFAWTPVTAGAVTLTAVATDSLGLQATSPNVAVTVTLGTPPVVAISAPTAGSTVNQSTPVTVTATATDADGTIASVQFFAGSTAIGTDTTAPYAVSWTPGANGDFTLTARATDNQGNVVTSSAVTVSVADGQRPVVSLSAPIDLTPINSTQATTITATATDADGTIASVRFVANGATIGTALAAPYSISWTPGIVGNFSITAIATDNLGNTTTSSAITVYSAAPPSISVSGASADPASAKPGDSVAVAIQVVNTSFTTVPSTNGSVSVPTATPANEWTVGGTATFNLTFTHTVTGASFTRNGVTGSVATAVPGLNGTGTIKVNTTVPTQTTQAGGYYISATLVSATGSGVTLGSPASFTSSVAALTVTGTPDFVITGLTYPAGTAYKGGDVVPMSISYANLATSANGVNNVPYVPSINGNASFVRIEVILSSNPTFGDSDDFLLTSHDITSTVLANSSNATINWNQLLPGNFVGSYYVMARIDTLGGVTETVENDLSINGNNTWFNETDAARINLLPANFPTVYWASPGSNGYSDNPALSGSGRYVAFASDATSLVVGDTNAQRDIFLFDSQTSLVRRINLSLQGQQANGTSNTPAISSDGRYVAFSSEATNLVLGDTNGFSDIFVVDTLTGTITRESVDSAGGQTNGSSFKPALSSDGRYLVYESTATNLVAAPAVPSGSSQIYRRDRTTGTTVLVSQSSGGTVANGNSLQASISGDGQYVAFASDASNLVAADANGVRDVFLRDVTAGTTVRASVSSGGVGGNGASRAPALNRNPGNANDGRFVVFGSEASNLVAGDTNGVSDIFVYDRVAATTVRVSVSSAGAQATDPSPAGFQLGSINPSINASGRYVTFASLADNLTAGDANGRSAATDSNGAVDVFVVDRDVSGSGTFDTAGNIATTMASVNRFGYQTLRLLGTPSTSASDIYPVISDDGRWVALPSDAENTAGLIHGATNRTSPDFNTFRDIFLHDRRINAVGAPGTPPTVTITSPGTGTTALVNTVVPITASATTTNGVVASVQFFVNGTSVGVDTTFPYEASWTPVATGSYTLTALVTDSFGNLGVSSTITATVNAAPSVGITAPAAGTLLAVNVAINVTATAAASNPGATITSVEFFANGVSLGTDLVAPYSLAWTPTTAGNFALTAVATDSNSIQTTSAAVTVRAGSPPTVVVTPLAGSVLVNAAQALSATATSPNGTITSVQFFVNGTALGAADTTFPYTAAWTPTAVGSFTLTAVAIDNVGNSTTSAAVTAVVTSGTAPTVSVTGPANGASVAAGSDTTVTATAAATTAGATIAGVQFFANGVAIGTADPTFPYSGVWTPSARGTFSLTAVATDTAGNFTTSGNLVNVTVDTNQAPTVTVNAPGALGVGVQTTLTATATDPDGTIASVQYFANGTAIGTPVTTAPYSFNFTSAFAGSIAITARATDDLGLSTTSAPATIVVSGGNAPAVAITAPTTLATIPVNLAQSVTATATAAVGSIANVEFRVVSGGTTTSLGTDTTFPYAATWTPTAVGSYTLTATATDTSGNQAVASSVITVTATSNTGPAINIISPLNAATYTGGTPIVLLANVSDSNGTISSVRFLVNGEVVGGTLTSAPFTTTWTPAAPAANTVYTLTAIAVDNDFNATTSAAIGVTISPPAGVTPTVTITSPVAGTLLTTNSTVPIVAGVSSAVVTLVEFFDNGVSLGTDNTAPFSLAWSPVTPGAHRLVAVATGGGNIVSSPPVDLDVKAATSPDKPTVTLLSPTNGSSVGIGTSPPATVTLTADARDNDGTISKVEFFINGTSVGSDVDFPYSLAYTPTSIGQYVVTAVATDNAGNVNTSAAVTFTTTQANAPVVTITTPAANATIPVNVAQQIDATAVPAAGRAIVSVQFLANGTPIATDTTFPYSINWTPTSPAPYTLTAIAVDDAAVSGSSAAVAVTVSPGSPPNAILTSPAAGTNLTVGAASSLTATATAVAPATIASVEFFVNGVSQGVDSTFPYSVAYTPNATGTNIAITVRATDSLGNTFTTTATLINVVSAPGPSVAIAVPISGTTVTVGTPTAVTANAAPVAGGTTVASVQFFANGVSIGTVVTAPYTVNWLPTTGGNFALTAKATDSAGTSTTSTAVTVNVTTPPATLSITGPTAGSVLAVNTPQTITVSASTASGTVSKVDFFVNGVALVSDTTFPFLAAWTPVTPGIFALTARATDNFGTATDSAVVTVTVSAGNVPTVAISTPLTGSTFVAGTTQTVVVNASAANGTIKDVELFANNVSLGIDPTFPYNFGWTPGGLGVVALTAVATDSQGNRAVSPPVNVTIAGISPGAPTVVLTAPAAGASLPVGVATLISAAATDADGTIAQVEFFSNGVSLGVDPVFPYNISFTPGATGSYIFTARATDNGGNVVTSTAVSVTVSGGTAPSIAIDAPLGGQAIGVNLPQTIRATATSSTGFIANVQFFLNGAPLATDAAFPYATTWTPGAVGSYTLTARATDNLGNITDSAVIAVKVVASAPPTVAITNPATGSAYTVGTPLTVAANAADPDGSITQVQFFVNGVPLGSPDTVSPYSMVWTANSVGIYALTAEATDNNGNVATSAPITVTIGANAVPTIALTSPAAGSYSLGNLILVAANANDSDGSVASVQFFANGLAIGTATAAPYNLSWRPTQAGTFALTAQATDNVGNVATAGPVNVSITSTAAPAVTITNPVVGTQYGVGNAIPFAATPSGGNGPIAQVQFFVNGASLGTADTVSPYSATWTPNAPGSYSLLAIATDSAGLSSSSSATLNITVSGNAAPTVALTGPPNGTNANGGALINLSAVATDADGTIASVRFIANGNVIGTATSLPYGAPWVPSAAGTYTVTAQATDNSGNVTNSAPITVTVVGNRAPTVTMTAPGNGSTARVGANTNLTATANDVDGTIASVQFFANGLAVGSPDTIAPYSATWTPGAEGIYRITALALDNSGATTVSSEITVLAIIPGAKGADTAYFGNYQSAGESGRFAALNARGSNVTFIAFSTTLPNRVYFFSGLPVDANGGFSLFDTVGHPLIRGSVSDTGATGTLDAGRVTFIGTISFGAGSSIASGYYTGSITGRPESVLAGIVGPDGTITIFVSDGSFQDAGTSVVAANGNFTITTLTGTRFTGRADPATGFLTGAITGGPPGSGGSFTAAVSSGASFSDGFLKNLSTRGQVGVGSDILIAGFIVAGESPKQVLIRAIGPSLTAFGVTGALADPQMQLFNGTALIATNDNWGGAAAISTVANLVGAFPLSPTSLDAVILTTLPPGSYTAQVSGVAGRTGVALVELYDADTLQPFSAQKVTNVATRGVVGSGQAQLIAGFVVSGNTAKKVLIRAVGPTLGAEPFNVGGVLADPMLRLVRSDSLVIRENDNWETGNDAALIAEASAKVGAFPLAAGAKDAAILINLPPGSYSAQVTGPGTTTGVALIEVYEVP